MGDVICKIAETEAERQGHFAVRHTIFVEEQQLFDRSDVDEHDAHAIPLIALTETGEVVGAVRVYPDEADATLWYGGRLAVLKTYRQHAGSIGANLCRLAEATVIEQGCQRFLAYIQLPNVRFFERLGWHKVGEPLLYCGVLHQLVAASLAKANQSETVALDVRQMIHA